MSDLGLVSNYTKKQYKVHRDSCNHNEKNNEVNREFDRKIPHYIVVSNLTYVNVDGKWNYIYLLIDLYNSEIMGYAAVRNKDTQLVYKAFHTVKHNLNNINIFHTNRGNQFKNKMIDEVLKTF